MYFARCTYLPEIIDDYFDLIARFVVIFCYYSIWVNLFDHRSCTKHFRNYVAVVFSLVNYALSIERLNLKTSKKHNIELKTGNREKSPEVILRSIQSFLLKSNMYTVVYTNKYLSKVSLYKYFHGCFSSCTLVCKVKDNHAVMVMFFRFFLIYERYAMSI